MPCGTCSLDGVRIVCALDPRCPAGSFCTITNNNPDHGVVVTVRQSFRPPSPHVTSTVILPAGGSQGLAARGRSSRFRRSEKSSVRGFPQPKVRIETLSLAFRAQESSPELGQEPQQRQKEVRTVTLQAPRGSLAV